MNLANCACRRQRLLAELDGTCGRQQVIDFIGGAEGNRAPDLRSASLCSRMSEVLELGSTEGALTPAFLRQSLAVGLQSDCRPTSSIVPEP